METLGLSSIMGKDAQSYSSIHAHRVRHGWAIVIHTVGGGHRTGRERDVHVSRRHRLNLHCRVVVARRVRQGNQEGASVREVIAWDLNPSSGVGVKRREIYGPAGLTVNGRTSVDDIDGHALDRGAAILELDVDGTALSRDRAGDYGRGRRVR